MSAQASPGEQALQKATEHLEATIASTATLEGRMHVEAPKQQQQQQKKPMHDTSMGTLEHRLEAEPSSASEAAAQAPAAPREGGQVADYNAWVHGPGGEASPAVASHGSSSRLTQPSD